LLVLTEFCYNSVEHKAIGMSLFQMVYGRQLLTPLNLMKEISKKDILVVEEILKEWKLIRDKCGEWIKQVRLRNQVEVSEEVTQEEEWVAERMKKSQKKMKENADNSRRDKVFEVGEEVLLVTKDFDLTQYSSRLCRKLR
jgi:hypothetical protein